MFPLVDGIGDVERLGGRKPLLLEMKLLHVLMVFRETDERVGRQTGVFEQTAAVLPDTPRAPA